jgi:hypothetical protein
MKDFGADFRASPNFCEYPTGTWCTFSCIISVPTVGTYRTDHALAFATISRYMARLQSHQTQKRSGWENEIGWEKERCEPTQIAV